MRTWKKIGLLLLGAATAVVATLVWFQKHTERRRSGS
jgi:hypothetical protein